MRRDFLVLAWMVMGASVFLPACKTVPVKPEPAQPEAQAKPAQAQPEQAQEQAQPAQAQPAQPAGTLRWQIPASLEADRAAYQADVNRALSEVSRFFEAVGFEMYPRDMIDSVVLFEKSSDARNYFTRTLGTPPDALPDTFAGTVEGRTLYLVSREAYRDIWKRLYPEWPWTDGTYHGLIVHELAHRAHEAIAISNLGSADAMGPPWFFEGLAMYCAGQFEEKRPPMTREEIERLVGSASGPPASYPLYAGLVRSLAAEFQLRDLIMRASEPGFPSTLWHASTSPKPPGE